MTTYSYQKLNKFIILLLGAVLIDSFLRQSQIPSLLFIVITCTIFLLNITTISFVENIKSGTDFYPSLCLIGIAIALSLRMYYHPLWQDDAYLKNTLELLKTLILFAYALISIVAGLILFLRKSKTLRVQDCRIDGIPQKSESKVP